MEVRVKAVYKGVLHDRVVMDFSMEKLEPNKSEIEKVKSILDELAESLAKIEHESEEYKPLWIVRVGSYKPCEPDVSGFTRKFECSICGDIADMGYLTKECDFNYCPNCGAKMERE